LEHQRVKRKAVADVIAPRPIAGHAADGDGLAVGGVLRPGEGCDTYTQGSDPDDHKVIHVQDFFNFALWFACLLVIQGSAAVAAENALF
jgi:hypothetical protein